MKLCGQKDLKTILDAANIERTFGSICKMKNKLNYIRRHNSNGNSNNNYYFVKLFDSNGK